MTIVLFEGVVPPDKAILKKLDLISLFKVIILLTLTLKNPILLFKLRNVWSDKYSWEFNMVFKCILDIVDFKRQKVNTSQVKYFGGDSLGTVTSSIAFGEIGIFEGLNIARILGQINDRIASLKLGLTSIVYSTGRTGESLEKVAHFNNLIKSKNVHLSVRLSDKLCVIVGPTKIIEDFINTKPENVFIKILGINKVTHYPKFAELITYKDREKVMKLAKKFLKSGKHLSNITGKEECIVDTPLSFAEESLGCIEKLVSVSQLYKYSKDNANIIVVGSNGYLKEIIDSL